MAVALEYLQSIDQAGFAGLHLFALDFIICFAPCRGGGLLRPLVLILSEARAEQSPAPTERTPKAPLPGADSPYQGEMSRRDKRGRDAVSRRLTERLYQICSDLSVSASPSHIP